MGGIREEIFWHTTNTSTQKNLHTLQPTMERFNIVYLHSEEDTIDLTYFILSIS